MKCSLRSPLRVLLAATLLLGSHPPASAQAPAPTSVATMQAQVPSAAAQELKAEEADSNEAYRHSPSVKKLGSMMGMNADQAAIAFEVANFVVLALLLGSLVLKTVPKLLRSRNVVIQKQLVDARTATEDASQRLKGVEDRLARLDGEIAAMRAQADKDSALEEQRIKAAVEDEKARLIASAEQEIAAAGSQVRREIQQYAAELAIEQAARKLVVSAETDRLLVQSFARRLGGDDSNEGQN